MNHGIASDPDGDKLTVTFTYPLDELGFWFTDYEDAGTYYTTAYASDGICTVSEDFTIVINDVPSEEEEEEEGEEEEEEGEENTCPSISDIPDQTIEEGDDIDINPIVFDADGDTLTLTFESPLNENGYWETDNNDAGKYTLTVSVTDGQCSASDEFTLTVKEALESTSKGAAGNKFSIDAFITNAGDLISNYCNSIFTTSQLTLSSTYSLVGNCLTDTSRDTEIQLLLTIQNKLSTDVDSLTATITNSELGISTSYTIGTIDAGETTSVQIPIKIPNNIQTGKYTLTISVQGEGISKTLYADVNIKSIGDAVTYNTVYEYTAAEQAQSIWERFINWIKNILNWLFS